MQNDRGKTQAKYEELRVVLGLPDRVRLGGRSAAVPILPWAKEAEWAEAYEADMADVLALEKNLFFETDSNNELELTPADRRFRQHKYDAMLRGAKLKLLKTYFKLGGAESEPLDSASALEIEDVWEVVLTRVFPTVAREEMTAQSAAQNLIRALGEAKKGIAKMD